MSELPKGWVGINLDKICDIIRGVTYKKEDAIDYSKMGYIPLYRANNIQNSKLIENELVYIPQSLVKESQLLKDGDIVVAMSSGSKSIVGKAAQYFSNEKKTFGAFCGTLRPIVSVQSKYVGYFTQTKYYRELLSSLSAGANINNLKPAFFGEVNVPLAPFAEQTRIVEKLDEVLAQVDTIKARLDGIPAILKRFRQSVLAAAVSGRLTKTLSKWRNEKLKDCFDCIDGDRGPNYPKKEEYLTEGYCLFLSTKNVRNFGFDFNEKIFITKEKDEILRKGRLERGDLVITTRGTLGYVASYDMTVPHEVVRINSGMLILRKKDSEFINDYFKILIASPYFQKQIEIQRTGSAQPQLPANVLKEFELPVPSYEEQKEIVLLVDQYFTFADTIEAQVKKAQARVDNLTQSILAKAFRGELVAQDPDDEPAEKLLERIAQARKEAEALAKAAKKVTKTK